MIRQSTIRMQLTRIVGNDGPPQSTARQGTCKAYQIPGEPRRRDPTRPLAVFPPKSGNTTSAGGERSFHHGSFPVLVFETIHLRA